MKKQIVIRTVGGYGKEGQDTLQNFMNQGYNVTFATKLGYEVEYILEKDVQLDGLYITRMELMKLLEIIENDKLLGNVISNETINRVERAERGIMKFLDEYR